MKKKILILVIMMVSFFTFNYVVEASSVSIKASTNSTTKGNNITVTTTISADSGIYTTEGTMTCTGAGVNKSADLSFEDLNTANTSKSFSMTIKVASAGTITCSTSNVNIRELSKDSRYQLNNSSVTITVKEPAYIPPKTYSSNNNLKSLEIEGYNLSPAFSKDTLEYDVELPNGTQKVVINATKEDSSASISGTGEKEVSEGTNKIEVKVSAENGNVKTYIINVTVKELDPIEVTVGENKYNIIRKEGVIEAPSNYEKSTIKIDDEDVLCYKNEKTGNILVGLKDENGNTKYYSYDERTKKYEEYHGYQIGGVNLSILKMPKDKIPTGYSKVSFEYNEDKLEGYQYNNKTNKSDFILIYGVNEITGKEGLYVYDKLENTVQRYNSNLILPYEEKVDTYFLYMLISVATLAVTIITFTIILIVKNKKKKHKKKFA